MKFSNLSLNGRAIVALAFVAVCSRFASADEVTTTAAPTTTLEPGNDNFSLETSRYGSLLLSVPVNGSLGNSSQTFAKRLSVFNFATPCIRQFPLDLRLILGITFSSSLLLVKG